LQRFCFASFVDSQFSFRTTYQVEMDGLWG
jgi:hypothetical protein